MIETLEEFMSFNASQKPLIDGVLMCFDGKAGVEVTGRDRNDVDADAAAEATLRLLQAS